MTNWLHFSPLPQPHWLQQAPTSPYDSLVHFFTSPSTMQATISHYDSLVAFFSFPSTMQATTGINKSLWLVGAFFCFSLDHTGYYWHQQVTTTCWCLFSLIPQPHQSQQAPMNLYGSLVLFFASPLTIQATPSTNESLWLVGCFFRLYLKHHYNFTSSSLNSNDFFQIYFI